MHLDIAFDQPITFETDKLYWVAIGAFSNAEAGGGLLVFKVYKC